MQNETKQNNKPIDFPFLIITIALLCIGLVMVSSASSYFSLTKYGNSSQLLLKQLQFALIGVVSMLIISKIDYRKYAKISYLGYIGSLVLMLAVLIPGIGGSSHGANRWINLGFTTIQPSEIMKLAIILAISKYLCRNTRKTNTIKLYIIPVIMIILVGVVMQIQSHFSGFIIIAGVAFAVIIISGIKPKPVHIIGGLILLAIIGYVYVFAGGGNYRTSRITAFLNPETDIKGYNWQVSQSLYALGSGGYLEQVLGKVDKNIYGFQKRKMILYFQ